MSVFESIKVHVKGKAVAENERSVETKAPSPSDVEMFSKNYWFGDQDQESVQDVKDPWMPQLSKSQRIIGFFTFLLLGIFCFVMAGIFLPFIVLKARKFVLLYTMGSLFTIGSFSLLWGPYNHMKHICSYERLPFTAAYFGTMIATLYCALMLKSTILTLICAIIQIISLLWYIFSYIPGGVTGMKFFSKLCATACTKTVGNTLPI